jgi:hypothetical protein
MAASATLTPFWTDLRFAFEARSLDAAADEVQLLIEAAERIGFRLELGHTTSEPPVDTE